MSIEAVLSLPTAGGVEINYFSFILLILLKPFDGGLAQPLAKRLLGHSWGCGMFLHQSHGTRGGNDSIMVGMFVCLCLARQNPFEREFLFPPEWT
jgi:hypothetical protein